MRCNNCGYDNAPGSSSCVKCGHPLQNDYADYDSNPYQNVRVPNYNNGGEVQPRPTVINTPHAEPAPRPTVINSNVQRPEPAPRPTRIVNGPMQQGAPMGQGGAQASQSCPYCGYPVMGNFSSCPNCGATLSQAQPAPFAQQPYQQPIQQTVVQQPVQQPVQPAPAPAPQKGTKKAANVGLDIDQEVKCDKCGTMVSLDFKFCPKCGERIHLPTMRVVRHKPTPPAPHFHLTLIPEEEEQIVAAKKDYEGTSVILTRENTEPDNRTITSKEQAELSFEDGKWFLLNKSELGSTYLEANRKLELQPGDIVVLGDRRFKFEAE